MYILRCYKNTYRKIRNRYANILLLNLTLKQFSFKIRTWIRAKEGPDASIKGIGRV